MNSRGTALVLATAIALAVVGCIAIPFPVVPEEDEFSDKNLAFIVPGESSRDEVIEQLGYPQIVRQRGQLVVYSQARTVGGLLVGVVNTAAVGPIESYSSLVIEYDQQSILQFARVIRGKDDCSDDGLYCIDSEYHGHSSSSIVFDFESLIATTVVSTTGERDAAAKRYLPPAAGCRIYVYETGRETLIKVYLSGEGSSLLNRPGYLYWSVADGPFTVYATAEGSPVRQTFDCLPPQPVFLNIYADKQGKQPSLSISTDDRPTGEQRVEERMLVLD